MRKTKILISFVVVLFLTAGLYFWIQYNEQYPSTSDAYIDAAVVRISPQVTGKVLKLPIKDHMHVTKGQLLLMIDPQPYELTVQAADSSLKLARQHLAAVRAESDMVRAQVEQRKVELADAVRNNKRMQSLMVQNSVATAVAEEATYKLKEAEAALGSAVADVNRMRRQVNEASIQIKVAEIQLAQARLELAYTRILSPSDGFLGKIQIRPGDIVQPGQRLFPLVEDLSAWVDANFKETDLQRIHPGQTATVEVDMYPGKKFNGVVESVSPASGVAFSLLPAENATGNWVKITQRFPIRIAMTDKSIDQRFLIGASSKVTVDTSREAL